MFVKSLVQIGFFRSSFSVATFLNDSVSGKLFHVIREIEVVNKNPGLLFVTIYY